MMENVLTLGVQYKDGSRDEIRMVVPLSKRFLRHEYKVSVLKDGIK